MDHFFQNIQGWFTFPNLYSRMVDRAFDGARFVEVGSWYGKSTAYMAVEIINSRKDICFFAVDTWKGSVEHKNEANIKKTGSIFHIFEHNMEPVEGKLQLTPMPMLSVDASKEFGNRSLDFVFIDAAHDYGNVKADINAWWPKVKLGGWIGGHDYSPDWPGVIQAVNEFFLNRGPVETFEGSWLYHKNSPSDLR